MKIVSLDGFILNPGDLSWEGFDALGTFIDYGRTSADQVLERVKDADAIFVNKVTLTREVIMQCENLKFIGTFATGYNIVDIDAARERGIPVCNIPTYGTTTVSQYVFALLLELCHNTSHHNEEVRKGRWQKGPDWLFYDTPQIELAGSVMGIIGLGKIGLNTAKIAAAFGMKVLAYDEYVNKDNENENLKYVSLDELLASSDVISLHCPLFDSTIGIINKDTIAKMKDGVILINTSRGPLIVEEDLAQALKSGKVYASAHDVVAVEPILDDNPLLGCENAILTPHIAWVAKAARSRMLNQAVANLKGFIDGKIVNQVN